jgi:ribosomal protein S6--L-glutamate ligase
VRRFEYLDDAIKLVGGYPVIIKSPFGTHGKGVAIIESRRSLYSALDMVWKYGSAAIILIQEYVAESMGSDYRAFVIGDKVVAAMQRIAPEGDFRSNLYLGGDAVSVKLTEQEEKIAIRASKALGLDTSGVDLMRTSSGPIVIEMNACAGMAGIMKATGINVPKELVKFAIEVARKNQSN